MKHFMVMWNCNVSVAYLKDKIFSKIGIAAEQQVFVWEGRRLCDDNHSLASWNIKHDSMIKLMVDNDITTSGVIPTSHSSPSQVCGSGISEYEARKH